DIYPHILAGRNIIVSEDFKSYREKISFFNKKYNSKTNVKSFEPIGKFLHDRFTDIVEDENEIFFSNYPFRFGEEIDSLLKNRSEVFSSTLYMLLLTAYKITLSLKTGLEEIPVIAPFVERNIEIEPILLGNFIYNLLCETKIEDSMTLIDVMNNVKKSVLGMVGFHDQSIPSYVNDVNILKNHAAFSWDVACDTISNDGIYVIVDPGNKIEYDPVVAEPMFLKQ